MENEMTSEKETRKANKQYKVIPGPMGIEVTSGRADEAFKSFEDIINANATNGWHFHSMETLTVKENPGCFGGGEKNSTYTNYYMLIFERDTSLSK